MKNAKGELNMMMHEDKGSSGLSAKKETRRKHGSAMAVPTNVPRRQEGAPGSVSRWPYVAFTVVPRKMNERARGTRQQQCAMAPCHTL